MGNILLYYKYVSIDQPEAIQKWQLELCKNLGLTGRIIIATEGINGTVAGSLEATNAYIDAMKEHPLFGGIDFKTAPGNEKYFPRIRVVVKDEIVRLDEDTQKVTVKDGGTHLTPEQVHELLNNKPDDLVILDTRNDYESRIGVFRDALTPHIKTFREFPEYINKNLDTFKDKKVLMYCTGGVRCERATAVLQQKGVAKEIYQVEGGIHRYVEKYPDGHFRGSNYVFDGRIAARINDDILSECDLCGVPSDFYTNCLNAECNKQYLSCQPCLEKTNETCSSECFTLVQEKKVTVRVKLLRTHLEIKK
ncbi:rhodanese-related sulfurtransferase [Candidatus Babeliales bacterium]|nr:rhodanese-related sulfurtransferase [Candidatus Babeliales bacterium]